MTQDELTKTFHTATHGTLTVLCAIALGLESSGVARSTLHRLGVRWIGQRWIRKSDRRVLGKNTIAAAHAIVELVVAGEWELPPPPAYCPDETAPLDDEDVPF